MSEMASCYEVYARCSKNLFCATDKVCRLTCKDIPGGCKDPCEIQNYLAILLGMVTVCLSILSIGLCLYRTQQIKIERIMKKYQLKDDKELEKVLERWQRHLEEVKRRQRSPEHGLLWDVVRSLCNGVRDSSIQLGLRNDGFDYIPRNANTGSEAVLMVR